MIIHYYHNISTVSVSWFKTNVDRTGWIIEIYGKQTGNKIQQAVAGLQGQKTVMAVKLHTVGLMGKET